MEKFGDLEAIYCWGTGALPQADAGTRHSRCREPRRRPDKVTNKRFRFYCFPLRWYRRRLNGALRGRDNEDDLNDVPTRTHIRRKHMSDLKQTHNNRRTTGAWPTKKDTPNVPIEPAEIAGDIRLLEGGRRRGAHPLPRRRGQGRDGLRSLRRRSAHPGRPTATLF